MKHEAVVKKTTASKKKGPKTKECGYLFKEDKIVYVMVPVEMFHEQFDNYNDENLFLRIYEYIEEINE